MTTTESTAKPTSLGRPLAVMLGSPFAGLVMWVLAFLVAAASGDVTNPSGVLGAVESLLMIGGLGVAVFGFLGGFIWLLIRLWRR